MRTSSVEAVVLLMSVLALLSLAPMAEAQVATPDYVLLDTERTSTMQQELQVAANGFHLVGQSHYKNPSSIVAAIVLDLPEMVAILERPIQGGLLRSSN